MYYKINKKYTGIDVYAHRWQNSSQNNNNKKKKWPTKWNTHGKNDQTLKWFDLGVSVKTNLNIHSLQGAKRSDICVASRRYHSLPCLFRTRRINPRRRTSAVYIQRAHVIKHPRVSSFGDVCEIARFAESERASNAWWPLQFTINRMKI